MYCDMHVAIAWLELNSFKSFTLAGPRSMEAQAAKFDKLLLI